MRLKQFYVIISLILTGTTLSCNKTDDDTYSAIDSAIRIDMMEVIDARTAGAVVKPLRVLELHCSTERSYPCHYIDVKYQQASNNTIDIVFKGVVRYPGVCIPPDIAFDTPYASTTVQLLALSNGVYNLNLSIGKVKHKGKLIVSSDSYRVDFNANSPFNFDSTTLDRIPEHTVFGYITYGRDEEETLSVIQSFFEALTDLGATKNTRAGYYRVSVKDVSNSYFLATDNGGNIEEITGGLITVYQSFIFHYSGDIAEVERVLKEHESNRCIFIYLFTNSGEAFAVGTCGPFGQLPKLHL